MHWQPAILAPPCRCHLTHYYPSIPFFVSSPIMTVVLVPAAGPVVSRLPLRVGIKTTEPPWQRHTRASPSPGLLLLCLVPFLSYHLLRLYRRFRFLPSIQSLSSPFCLRHVSCCVSHLFLSCLVFSCSVVVCLVSKATVPSLVSSCSYSCCSSSSSSSLIARDAAAPPPHPRTALVSTHHAWMPPLASP